LNNEPRPASWGHCGGQLLLTAALAKHFSLIAAHYLPSWEIIDYASAAKIDAPSGTTRELAEELASISQNQLGVALEQTHGAKEARGATIEGTQVHSIRLPGYVIAFETIFGLPAERLSIRHDAGSGAQPYVSLAVSVT
jgi:4-hydroxy-tetrahydrodipicolinate reductase